MPIALNRRHLLAGLPALVAGVHAVPACAEPPPETAAIRILAYPAACLAPLYLAKDLLREEGFVEVRYVAPADADGVPIKMLADGKVDFSMESGFDFLPLMDAGSPLLVLAGIHTGCHELRANDSVRTVADLRGKRVAVTAPLGFSADYLMVSAMATYVGLDPSRDITWVANPNVNQIDLFKAGDVDAFIGFPPSPRQPCARDVGHVVVNTATDPPWSDCFCCMATANGNFARSHPVATKRALRALLKATDLCHREPERTAQRMFTIGFSAECARMILNDARYGLWRDYDPEHTVRFMALRLHEAGIINKTPNEIVSGFTNTRFLDELKRELKA
jgi:NitT/TauT family transport system substrate-binding protein